MSIEKVKDILDWRSERARKIEKVVNNLNFDFAIISDKEYTLGPYELIRLVNIIATSRRIGRSLDGFERSIKRQDRVYELPDWSKPYGGLRD